LENYLTLLGKKGDYGWAWVELGATPKRQQELGKEYDEIRQEVEKDEQEKFIKNFQEVAKNEGIDVNSLDLIEDKIVEY